MDSRWLVAFLFVLTTLSGCLAPAPETDPEPTDALDGAGNGNATVEQNLTAPVPRITLEGNGTAPLLVNITLEADGNVTAWTLDLGDGNSTEGDALPATLNHTYAAGNHSLTFHVSGPGGNATATHVVNVTAAVEAAVEALQPFEMTVDLDLPCVGCGDGGTLTCAWRAHGQDSARDCAWIDFPDELVGQPFTLTGTGLDPDVLFWNACDDGVNAKFNSLMSGESGIIPEGAGCALVWEQFDFLISVTLRIEPA